MVELAVTLAFLLLPLLIGTGEMATLAYDSIEISNAAHAGASYGMQNATLAADTATIISAAQQEAADFGTNLTVTPSIFYVCSNAIAGTQYTGSSASSNANSACTGSNNRAIQFLQVVASAKVSPSLHLPGLPSSFVLTQSSVMEVEQ